MREKIPGSVQLTTDPQGSSSFLFDAYGTVIRQVHCDINASDSPRPRKRMFDFEYAKRGPVIQIGNYRPPLDSHQYLYLIDRSMNYLTPPQISSATTHFSGLCHFFHNSKESGFCIIWAFGYRIDALPNREHDISHIPVFRSTATKVF